MITKVNKKQLFDSLNIGGARLFLLVYQKLSMQSV